LGLKERSDKRDAIALAASLTGFQVDFHDSVNGDDVTDKARPPVCTTSLRPFLIVNSHLQGMGLKGGAMGCWRGHLDIIRRFVQICL
jgi:hypothetical protein